MRFMQINFTMPKIAVAANKKDNIKDGFIN